jgi:Cdc6-like AAA superfamily ATPase
MQRTLCHKMTVKFAAIPANSLRQFLQIISLPWRTMEQGERRSGIEAHQYTSMTLKSLPKYFP